MALLFRSYGARGSRVGGWDREKEKKRKRKKKEKKRNVRKEGKNREALYGADKDVDL